MSVRLTYTDASSVTHQLVFEPENFTCEDVYRAKDNLSTSGYRERVLQAADALISFTLPGLVVGVTLGNWLFFYRWASVGGQFSVEPNYQHSSQSYHCVLEDTGCKTTRVALKVYSLAARFRIVPDSSAPFHAGEVMDSFWGLF